MKMTTREAARKFEIEIGLVRTWISHGYVNPSEEIGPSGQRYIEGVEVEILELIALLTRAGVTVSVAALIARGESAPLRDLQRAVDKARTSARRIAILTSGGT